jgi:hypothetical protein
MLIENILSSQPIRHQQLNYNPCIHPTSELSCKESEEEEEEEKRGIKTAHIARKDKVQIHNNGSVV